MGSVGKTLWKFDRFEILNRNLQIVLSIRETIKVFIVLDGEIKLVKFEKK